MERPDRGFVLATTGIRAVDHGHRLAARRLEINWRRLARRSALVIVPALAVEQLLGNAVGSGQFGADFHHGIWPAGWAVLHGTSPYPVPDSHRLLTMMHAFIDPPLLAILAAPLSLLPFSTAIGLWDLLGIVALCAALYLTGVRDKRIYVLALCSFPFWESLENGQPDGLLALGAALAWRYRDSPAGAVAAGALIAAKLLAWPLLIWMLVTRRFQSLLIAAGSAIALLLGSWAVIGFKGLAQYPRLVAADAKAFETNFLSLSIVNALSPLGFSLGVTRALAVGIALALALAIVVLARRSDEGLFAAALAFGVLSSPIVWFRYLVVLFVPLAFVRRRAVALWSVVAYSYWLILILLRTAESRAVAFAVVTACCVAWATTRGRRLSSTTVRGPISRALRRAPRADSGATKLALPF